VNSESCNQGCMQGRHRLINEMLQYAHEQR